MVIALDHNYLDEILNRPLPRPGAELALGDLIRPSADDRIVFELRPGLVGRFAGHDVRINSLGMRARERALAKPPGTFRVVGLGDSHMFGWGVGQEETFLAELERTLGGRFPDRRFEVWNLGVPGYNTVQEVRALERRLDALTPDLVIVNFVDNDMDLPNFLYEHPRLWSLSRSYLADLVARRLAVHGGNVLTGDGLRDVVPDAPSKRFRMDDDRIPERYRPLSGWGNMTAALHHLAEIARERGFRLVLLMNFDDYKARLAGKTNDIRPSSARRLAEECAEVGYLIVDPQDRIFEHLRANGLDTKAIWVSRSDPHSNALRHRLVAEELFASLTAHGVL